MISHVWSTLNPAVLEGSYTHHFGDIVMMITDGGAERKYGPRRLVRESLLAPTLAGILSRATISSI